MSVHKRHSFISSSSASWFNTFATLSLKLAVSYIKYASIVSITANEHHYGHPCHACIEPQHVTNLSVIDVVLSCSLFIGNERETGVYVLLDSLKNFTKTKGLRLSDMIQVGFSLLAVSCTKC